MPTERPTPPRLAQILLTLGVLEFFGPIVRDTDATHLLNPSWPGHARFHLAWLLGLMLCSGLVNLYLIWGVGDRRALITTWVWQACNVVAFWGAAAVAGLYGGLVVDGSFHQTILGLNENLFVFVLLGTLALVILAILRHVPHD